MKLDRKQSALQLLDVSRETSDRLGIFVELLFEWQKTINLVSRASLQDVWMRHVADSGQLVRFAPPAAKVWVDIGSGAGFPGAIVGILLAGLPGAVIHLIESDQRKAGFLRVVSRETMAPLIVHGERAEKVLPALPSVDVITSRATASLAQLVSWSQRALVDGAVGLFLKGESVSDELTPLRGMNNIRFDLAPSLTRPAAAIVEVRAVPPGRDS